MIGFATTLIVVYIHSYFEWVFFAPQVQYMFAMSVGMIAGLAQQLGYWQRAKVGGGIGVGTRSALQPLTK